jgi:sugar lactone lactonase YvrE
VLIDPRGYVVGTATGEGYGARFEEVIEAVATVFADEGTLDRTPRPLSPESAAATGTLAFPGKVLADGPRSRLFVADTGHHRIVETDLGGRIARVFGDGSPGWEDGTGESARFVAPQGMALHGDTLWIADSGNHLVRKIELSSGRVGTAAGTGRQATWQQSDGGAALETSLNSPWDLAWDGRLLFVAMAGPHQVWLLDPVRGIVIRYAGTGAEGRYDGHVDQAAFAQPSGMALVGRDLFVADAEANVVRIVALPPLNQVRTIAGGDLFEFGDEDGAGDDVRFQHPLGLCAVTDGVLVADTYNHRIRHLDPVTGRVRRWAGSGRPGHVDGAAATACFYEPGGLSTTGRHVYVADTNNHAVRVVDVASGDVQTLGID